MQRGRWGEGTVPPVPGTGYLYRTGTVRPRLVARQRDRRLSVSASAGGMLQGASEPAVYAPSNDVVAVVLPAARVVLSRRPETERHCYRPRHTEAFRCRALVTNPGPLCHYATEGAMRVTERTRGFLFTVAFAGARRGVRPLPPEYCIAVGPGVRSLLFSPSLLSRWSDCTPCPVCWLWRSRCSCICSHTVCSII